MLEISLYIQLCELAMFLRFCKQNVLWFQAVCWFCGSICWLVNCVQPPQVDGCSINPNRSLGPALVSKLRGRMEFMILWGWFWWTHRLEISQCLAVPMGITSYLMDASFHGDHEIHELGISGNGLLHWSPWKSWEATFVLVIGSGCSNYTEGGIAALWMMPLGDPSWILGHPQDLSG